MNEFRLLLTEEEVEHLKVLAAKQRVRPQQIAREAFRAGMAGSNNQVLTGYLQPVKTVLDSSLAKSLVEAREALSQALAVLDGVLSDGRSIADQIGAIERAIATGENPGSGGESDSEDGVKAAP